MADPQERTFPCPGCGRKSYWREANVGRPLRCHVCGRQVEVPREPPEGAPPSEAVFSGRVAGEYDTATGGLTLVGELAAPAITGLIHFELNPFTP